MSWDTDPWTARWGIISSTREGQRTLAESSLWELERTHPEVFERAGGVTWLHLGGRWRVLEHSDRSYVSLVPDGEGRRDTEPERAPAAPQAAPSPA